MRNLSEQEEHKVTILGMHPIEPQGTRHGKDHAHACTNLNSELTAMMVSSATGRSTAGATVATARA